MENGKKKHGASEEFARMARGRYRGKLDLDAEHDEVVADRMKRLGIDLP